MVHKFTFFLLKAMARLPLAILYLISDFLTLVIYHLVKYRRKVVRQNLLNSFPKKTLKEIKRIERNFYRYLGDQIVETIKLLHISEKALKKRVEVTRYDLVNQSLLEKRNVVLLLGHYCNWEWVQEITHYFVPQAFMTSIYHPLSNKVWDDFFLNLRSRWHAHIVSMERAPRVLLNKENMPWVCGFIADAWYMWHKDNNWIEFLNQKTWFIPGPEIIGEKVDADFFYLEMIRIKRGYYQIKLHPLHPEDMSQPFPYTRQFWKEFEETIKRAPAYWLWSHKRWK